MDEGTVDCPGPPIFDSPDSLCLSKATHRGMQGEADVNHLILESTYLLFHLVRLIHQRPVPMYFGTEPSVFFVNEGSIDPLRSRIFAE